MTSSLFDCILCPKMAEDIPCPRCGGLTPDALYCKHCGETLHACPSCKAKIPRDARYCTQCGKEVSSDVSPEGQPGVKAYARYGPSMVPDDILIEGEETLFETRPVLWLRLMSPIAFTVVGIGILVSIYFPLEVAAILYGCIGVFALGSLWAAWAWYNWTHTIFAATNYRVLRQSGLLKKSYVDCPLRSVQNINLETSLWGRINHFGTMHISGGNVEIDWENIYEPREAHRTLNQIVEQHRRR